MIIVIILILIATIVCFYGKTTNDNIEGFKSLKVFYNKKHNYQKALYYIDKAINIDSENVLYWKRYAKINYRLNLFEEAEIGYRKTLELGNYELNTWLIRNDVLMQLGEYEAATNNLFQAAEFYPECAEIEYRLAGLYFNLNELFLTYASLFSYFF